MYCRQCGKAITDGVRQCPSCGARVGKGKRYCPYCGTAIRGTVCMNCGFSFDSSASPQIPAQGKNITPIARVVSINQTQPVQSTPPLQLVKNDTPGKNVQEQQIKQVEQTKASAPIHAENQTTLFKEQPSISSSEKKVSELSLKKQKPEELPPEKQEPEAICNKSEPQTQSKQNKPETESIPQKAEQEAVDSKPPGEKNINPALTPIMQKVLENEILRQQSGYAPTYDPEGKSLSANSDVYLDKYKDDQATRRKKQEEEREIEKKSMAERQEQLQQRNLIKQSTDDELKHKKKSFKLFHHSEHPEHPEHQNSKPSSKPDSKPKVKTKDINSDNDIAQPKEKKKNQKRTGLQIMALIGFLLSLIGLFGVVLYKGTTISSEAGICAIVGLFVSIANKKNGYFAIAGILLSIIAIICFTSPVLIRAVLNQI